jgi:DNA polymerase I-like protein with 3'-5' exonuclease and polymerase domains
MIYTTPGGTKYTYIKTVAEAEIACQRLLQEKVSGYDTETTGTDFLTDKVILASFSTPKETFLVDTRDPRNLLVFAPYFENEEIRKVTHYGLFDYLMTKGTIGIDVEGILCLMMAEIALNAGRQFDGFGLADVMLKYLGRTMDKTMQKSFIGHKGDFTREQLDYAADDTAFLIPCGKEMQKAMLKEFVQATWLRECAAIPAFGDMEFYGQRIDKAAWEGIMATNLENANKAKEDLDRWFEPVCDRQWDLTPGNEGKFIVDINYDSQPQVLHALQKLGIQVDGATIKNTNKSTQKKIKDLGPIKALTAYRSAVKLYGTYGQQYIDAIRPETGRVHFRFRQYGTETGRPACYGGLNCLNIPRDSRYRHAFGTEPGRLISTVDYSGAELRIMADLSGDPLMVQGFNSGEDFHCFVASMVFGVPVTKNNENAKLRTPTKSINFGLAYGMGPGKLCEDLNGMGYKITLEETKEIFEKYMKTFETTITWLNDQKRAASTNFYMANMNGRRRYWFKPNVEKIEATAKAEMLKMTHGKHDDWLLKRLIRDKKNAHLSAVEREGANFQIQSVNADMTKSAMASMRREFKKRRYDARMYNSVYDEIVLDVAQGCGEEVHELHKKIMMDEANKMLKRVPMEVEGHLKSYWTK